MKLLSLKYAKSGLVLVSILTIAAGFLMQSGAEAANTFTGSNSLASVNNTDGNGGNNSSGVLGVSSDGNIILFSSAASNLPGAAPTMPSGYSYGIYERNFSTGTTTRIDVSNSGIPSNDYLRNAVMSENGRYVAFTTKATNLIDGTTSATGQTYLRDVKAGTTIMVSVDTSGSAVGYTADYSDKWDVVTGVSNDGRFISWDSTVMAQNVISGAPFNSYSYYDVLVRDQVANSWIQLDKPTGTIHNQVHSNRSQMSCDGSFVVFQTGGNIAGGTYPGVYMADLRNGFQLKLIASSAGFPHISCNGNYVVYDTTNRTEISPTPTGMDNSAHLAEYNRLSENKQYIDDYGTGTYNGGSNNTISYTTLASDLYGVSVADNGDATFNWGGTPGFGPYYRYRYFKHLNDGSRTMEQVEKTPGGTYLSLKATPAYLSANDKYIVYGSTDAYALGLTSATSTFTDAIRSSTGQ